MEHNNSKDNKEKISYFRTLGKIVIILFIGFSIYLIISAIMLIFLTKPSNEVKVPDVVGKRFIDVYNSLIRKEIKPEIKFRDVFDIDDGIILHQYPQNGKIVSENSKLKLIVSRGSFYIHTPSLIGTELPIAINKLRNLHYHGRTISIGAGVISYIPSEKTADNIIIDQSPKSGEKITPDRKINLLVSVGKLTPGKKIPDVIGQSINLCFDLLAAKGLIIQEEIVETWNIKESGIVTSQKPASDTEFKKGDIVKLKVKWYQLKEHPYIAYEKVDYRIPKDQESGLYEVYIEDNFSKRIRFSREMKPNQRIEFIFHRVGNAKISILLDKKTIGVMSIDVEEFE